MKLIPHNRPSFDSEEESAAIVVLRSGWVAQGPQVAAFEDELCAFLGLPAGHGVAVSSGSAALYLALLALGVQGKSVAAPAYSCRALQNAIELAGGTPEWVDIAQDGPNLDAHALAKSRAQVAIVAHMYGIPTALPCDLPLTVIEDCAQALGAEISGKKAGTIGKIAIFSFAATKLMTAGGQGGMVVSRDPAIVEFLREARNYDTVPDNHPRFNLQMTDLQASIGRVQLRKLPYFLARRETIFQRYKNTGIDLFDAPGPDSQPVRFRAVIRTTEPMEWQERLAKAGVRTIVPVTHGELLAAPNAVPRAAALSQNTLSLPLYPTLKDEEVDDIVRHLGH